MRRLLPIVLAVTALLGAAYALTVVLPASDDSARTAVASTRGYPTVGDVRGRRIYVDQGCIYCHTQQIRDTFTDAGLGSRPNRRGDALRDRPNQFGETRYGPDLSCIGDRVPGAAASAAADARVTAMIDYLRDPPAVHQGSTMPDYAFLSDAALRRLASYLTSMTCDTNGGIFARDRASGAPSPSPNAPSSVPVGPGPSPTAAAPSGAAS